MSTKPTTLRTTGRTDSVSATTAGFGLSFALTSILSALLVVWKESSERVHDGLAALTGHHWVTHSLLDVIVFFLLGFVLVRVVADTRMTANTLITAIVGATVISGLIIAGYFI
jgi:hypothetical protein